MDGLPPGRPWGSAGAKSRAGSTRHRLLPPRGPSPSGERAPPSSRGEEGHGGRASPLLRPLSSPAPRFLCPQPAPPIRSGLSCPFLGCRAPGGGLRRGGRRSGGFGLRGRGCWPSGPLTPSGAAAGVQTRGFPLVSRSLRKSSSALRGRCLRRLWDVPA